MAWRLQKVLSRQASVYIANYSDTQQVIGQVVALGSYVQTNELVRRYQIRSSLSTALLALFRDVRR